MGADNRVAPYIFGIYRNRKRARSICYAVYAVRKIRVYNYFGIATINGSMVGLNLDGNYLEVATGATTAVFERQCYNQLGKSYLVIGFR